MGKKMHDIIRKDLSYMSDKKDGGFIFKIRESECEKTVFVKNITDAAAEKFLSMIKENGVEPVHLFDIAQDYDFAEITEAV